MNEEITTTPITLSRPLTILSWAVPTLAVGALIGFHVLPKEPVMTVTPIAASASTNNIPVTSPQPTQAAIAPAHPKAPTVKTPVTHTTAPVVKPKTTPAPQPAATTPPATPASEVTPTTPDPAPAPAPAVADPTPPPAAIDTPIVQAPVTLNTMPKPAPTSLHHIDLTDHYLKHLKLDIKKDQS